MRSLPWITCRAPVSCVSAVVRTIAPVVCALFLLAPPAAAEETYSFDVGQFTKKPYELNGYVELRAEHLSFDEESALYQLNFFDREPRSHLDRTAGAFELSGLYRAGRASFHATVHGDARRDALASEAGTRVYEGYALFEPSVGNVLSAGKRAMRWGKGYAWNPVGFVERAKDPDDPELSREGFTVLAGELVRSRDGPLQTLTVAPLLIPTGDDLNEDFGAGNHTNPALRLSLLYRDTDIDFFALGEGARSARYGWDFARNLTSNFEIHGEWARITDLTKSVVSAAGVPTTQSTAATSYLLGVRYLSASDTTWIVEYYRNGAGYTEQEMRDYFTFVHAAHEQFTQTGDATPLERARTLGMPYNRPNPMRRYLYLRVSQKEPFDLLYFTPSLTLIRNLEDHSYSLAPELAYTGVNDLELRLRLFHLAGDRLTEFGEKQNERRFELRVRYHF